MIRKITLLCLLLTVGFHSYVKAQVHESVSIYIPPYTDTTCPGSQLTFTAVQSIDTFSTTSYHWFVNNVFTGVTLDTFYTTAPVDGDSIYCEIYYINSAGLDSARSNTIIVHRSPSIAPGVVIALTTGSNPYCSPTLLTFTAFPINGGTAPTFQWAIDGLPILGEDSTTFSRVFAFGDTVSVRVVSNSTCSAPYNDTVYSIGVPIIHDSLTAGISIVAAANPICPGGLDSFMASISSPGSGYNISWYVDSTLIPAALGPKYITDSIHNGDLVYAILTAPDPCIVNHSTVSNVITMTVIPALPTSVWWVLSAGANPGCLDSVVTLTGHFSNFGTLPDYTWYVNGVAATLNDSVLSQTFNNGDTVVFRVNKTDDGCYSHDTLTTPPLLMVRDSTPEAPLVSLIGDLLEVNDGSGSYVWYDEGVVIPGATTPFYHPGHLGHYYAVKDTNNCFSLPSNVIYISLLDVNRINNVDKVSIYPNPTSGVITVDWGAIADKMGVDVFDVTGQGIAHFDANGESHLEMNLSYLAEGNYFVVLRDAEGRKSTYKVQLTK